MVVQTKNKEKAAQKAKELDKSKNPEIDDWLVQQEAYRSQPMKAGANIFTHKIIPMKRQAPTDGEGMLSL